MEFKFVTHIKFVFEGDRRAEIVQSCLGLDVLHGRDYLWPDVSFEISTISPWDERSKRKVGSHPLVIGRRVVDGVQSAVRRRNTYLDANMADLCFSVVDPETLESLRNRASPAVVSSAVSITHSL